MSEAFRRWIWRRRSIPARVKLWLSPRWTQAEVDDIRERAEMDYTEFSKYITARSKRHRGEGSIYQHEERP